MALFDGSVRIGRRRPRQAVVVLQREGAHDARLDDTAGRGLDRGLRAQPRLNATSRRTRAARSMCMRTEVTFRSGADVCAAWLYRPAAAGDQQLPIVVMAHGLSGTRRDRLGPFAERFAAAGLLRARLRPPRLRRQRRRAGPVRARDASSRTGVRRSRSRAPLPGVDPERVATFGSSMGGGNALAAAAGDPRVAAAISQVPFLDIVRQAHRSSPRVTARDAARRGRAARTCRPSARPDEAAFINAPGAEAGLAARRRDRRGLALARPRLLALAARPAVPAGPPRARAALPVARLRRRGRPRRAAGTGDRGGAPRAARRAAHLPGRRPLRHLRRARARGARRRPARLPARHVAIANQAAVVTGGRL